MDIMRKTYITGVRDKSSIIVHISNRRQPLLTRNGWIAGRRAWPPQRPFLVEQGSTRFATGGVHHGAREAGVPWKSLGPAAGGKPQSYPYRDLAEPGGPAAEWTSALRRLLRGPPSLSLRVRRTACCAQR